MKSPRISPVNRELLSDDAVNNLEQLGAGQRWNVFEIVSNNPQVFTGLRQFRESLDVDLTPVEHEVIALEMARQNGCGYCLPAHVIEESHAGTES